MIYAAKSSEDRRGSIPNQLRDCHEALQLADGRAFVAEYSDEARSAYLGDRGPGLAEAMVRAEDLAREHGTCELWAQHSDRLARGDGRSARHAVEIALWALKRDVRVRTIQDPDTFRDLLYAVVTGQRNHEDSRRKGLASAAGRRRAVERGEYVGIKADGYRVVVEIDSTGSVVRRLEIDPDREAAIKMLFRLGLRGRTSGEIARALNMAGWRTKPRKRDRKPIPWDPSAVLGVLHNPRYAGLSVSRGEIIGAGQWPAYITPRQHERLQALIAERWRRRLKHHGNEAFWFSRLVRCGVCGGPLHCHTGRLREDATFARRYLCRSHWRDRHEGRCTALPLDADVVEAMFAASLSRLLGSKCCAVSSVGDISWCGTDTREEIRDAVLAGDDEAFREAVDRIVSRASNVEGTLAARATLASESFRRKKLERAVGGCVEMQGRPPTRQSRQAVHALNGELREWFLAVTAHNTATHTVLACVRRPALRGGVPPEPARIELSRREWILAGRRDGRLARSQPLWSDEEILQALRDWADYHGRAPNSCEWIPGSPERPGSFCVRRRFGSWEKALRRAGLKPNQRRQHRFWTDGEIIDAICAWTKRHGRPPIHKDWVRAGRDRPCARSVCQHFGTFSAGVLAAGPSVRTT